MSIPEVSSVSTENIVWSEDLNIIRDEKPPNGYQTPPREGMGLAHKTFTDTPESPDSESFDSFFSRTTDTLREELGEVQLPPATLEFNEDSLHYLGKCYPRRSQVTTKQRWKAVLMVTRPDHGDTSLMTIFKNCVKRVEYDLEVPSASRLFREIIRRVMLLPISREIGFWIDTIIVNLPLIEPNTKICELAAIFKARQRQGYSSGVDHDSTAGPDSALNISFAAHNVVHHDALKMEDRVSRIRSIPTETITVRSGSSSYNMPLASLLENPYFPWIYYDELLDQICMTEHHPQVYLSQGEDNSILNLIGDFSSHFRCLEWFCRFVELTFLYIKHPFVVRRNTIRKTLYLDTITGRYGRDAKSHNATLFDLFDLFKSKELKVLFCDIYYLPKLRSARQMYLRKEPTKRERSHDSASSLSELKHLVMEVELCCKGYYSTRFATADEKTFSPAIPDYDFPSSLYVESSSISGPHNLLKLQNCIISRIESAKRFKSHSFTKFEAYTTDLNEENDDSASNSAVIGCGDC